MPSSFPRGHDWNFDGARLAQRESRGKQGSAQGLTRLVRDESQFGRSGEQCRNVAAPDVAQVKLSRAGDAVRLFDEFRFGHGDELIEHAIDASVARSGLMNQP